MSHSKSPWTITKSAKGPVAISHADDTVSCVAVFDKQHPNPIVENPSNALLIAAAPELLAMCEEALEAINNNDGTFHSGLSRSLKRVIEKAKGEL